MRKNGPNTTSPQARKTRWLPSKRLRELIEDAIVDTYTESEQRTGLFIMIEDHLALPFNTELLSVTLNVERIDLFPSVWPQLCLPMF